jgi:hypothetical protein
MFAEARLTCPGQPASTSGSSRSATRYQTRRGSSLTIALPTMCPQSAITRPVVRSDGRGVAGYSSAETAGAVASSFLRRLDGVMSLRFDGTAGVSSRMNASTISRATSSEC